MSRRLQLHIPQILLADDDSDDCHLFQDALVELPFATDLTIVRDGQQLLDYLLKAKEIPDVLFLDLNMPRRTGFECLSEMKSDFRLKAVPVIILSTSSEADIVDLVYEKGAHYYICKPNDYSSLVMVVHRAITVMTEPTRPNGTRPSRRDFVLSPRKVLQ